jgi:hypothetical protein
MLYLRRTSETKTKKETQSKFHKAVASFKLFLHGSDFWTTKAKDMKLTDPAESTCIETITGCTRLDHTKNEDTRKTMKIQSIQNR